MSRSPKRGPRTLTVRNAEGAVLCERCTVAETPGRRMRGLLGRELAASEGLLLTPANSIHMFFMRQAIDALFLDRDDRVLRVVHELAPWRIAAKRGARSVIELRAGECRRHGVQVGDLLELSGAAAA